MNGGPKLIAVLRRLGDAGPAAAGRALYHEGERIMTAAKRLTPVRFGALRNSGQVVAESATRVVLAFGNDAVSYAVYVHENLQARHHVGQAKFLERPLLEAARGLDARLAADVRRQIERVSQ